MSLNCRAEVRLKSPNNAFTFTACEWECADQAKQLIDVREQAFSGMVESFRWCVWSVSHIILPLTKPQL